MIQASNSVVRWREILEHPPELFNFVQNEDGRTIPVGGHLHDIGT